MWIPKPDGKQRPLGIPTIKDRVAKMAAVLVLEPIFETDLPPEQYAYQPGRGTWTRSATSRRCCNRGIVRVVDADLSGYFDSIPHAELLKSLARRISDGAIDARAETVAVHGGGRRGRTWAEAIRTTRNRDEGKGTPQGAPISPLLSNLYMRRFVLGWQNLGCLSSRPRRAHRRPMPTTVRHDGARRRLANEALLSSLAAQEMRAGPSGSDCRIRVQTATSRSRITAGVVSVDGKGG